MTQDTPLSALAPLREFRQPRQHIFPSDGSLTWYVRQHRASLIQAGALVWHAGRMLAVPERFDAYILEAAKRAAEARQHAAAAEEAAA